MVEETERKRERERRGFSYVGAVLLREERVLFTYVEVALKVGHDADEDLGLAGGEVGFGFFGHVGWSWGGGWVGRSRCFSLKL